MALDGSYLDIDELAERTIAPTSLVMGEHLDPTARAPWVTFVGSCLKIETSKINARLRKRYETPFATPYPEIVRGWLVALVTPLLYRRRGVDSSDEQIVAVDAAAKAALDEMKEAADAVDGLFDLPLKQDDTSSAISKGGPLGYSEASPYTWTDVQREAVDE